MRKNMYAYLWDRINRLEQEMEELRSENEQLRKKVDSIQPLSIEQLVYKIQELNVQTLSGTLNVGLTTQGDGENITDLIEKLHQEGKGKFEIGEPKESSSSSIAVEHHESSSPSNPLTDKTSPSSNESSSNPSDG
ncbi:spore germination protein GerPC [Melghirimyces algeriensis]|uniref:Spore germination protein GerPC n=1 Tax=Melghirimyces algeriensis TaxID=910412 RepID=A0A521DV81_9BACL|nr:spore germination protein GerPC [Melghirimyces algeriensis]SMO75639.1 Spore germination protein GerPC [Melghirimyces algeriensis]